MTDPLDIEYSKIDDYLVTRFTARGVSRGQGTTAAVEIAACLFISAIKIFHRLGIDREFMIANLNAVIDRESIRSAN